jgi:hypothetical protein
MGKIRWTRVDSYKTLGCLEVPPSQPMSSTSAPSLPSGTEPFSANTPIHFGDAVRHPIRWLHRHDLSVILVLIDRCDALLNNLRSPWAL